MAETKKKVAKKPSSKQVDSIIVILIAIIVLAVIAGGIVLLKSFKTEPLAPVTNPGEEITDKGSYADYLKKLKEEKEKDSIPVDNDTITKVVLGTDNYIYIVYKDTAKNVDSITGSDEKGAKYSEVTGVVKLFEAKTTSAFHLFALTDNGTLYEIDLATVTSKTYNVKEVVEVYKRGTQVEVKKFDGTTELIIE